MSSSNPPEPELREWLREVAAADAPGLLDRARRRATARAEQLIEDALVEELVRVVAEARRSGAPSAPPEAPVRPETEPDASPDGGEAYWTYCIMWKGDALAEPRELEGVEPGTFVETICDGELTALVSRVPLPDYGDERLRRRLEDLAWVERTARRHEDVLEAALGKATIVPLRLCTLYRSRDGVRRLLQEHRSALEDGLSRVDGCLEWAVKVFSDPRGPDSRAARPEMAGEAAGGEQRGVAYLQRRQQERALADTAGEVRARCVEVVHQRVEGLARAATVNPPQRPEVHGRELKMLLNGAYLIERGRTAELRETVEILQEEWGSLGFAIEVTGPWPPYNFVSGAAGVMS